MNKYGASTFVFCLLTSVLSAQELRRAVDFSSKARQKALTTVEAHEEQCIEASPANNNGPDEFSDNFCQAPYAAVCGEPLENGEDPPSRVAREKALKSRIGEFSQEALEAARQSLVGLGRWPKDKTKFTQDDLDSALNGLKPHEKMIVQTGLLFKYWAGLKNPIGKLERKFVAKVPELRKFLDAAIRRNVADKKRAESMVEEMGKIEIISTYEIHERFKDRPEVLAQFLDSFQRICGTLGLNDNAFAKTTLDGKKYFMFCPGMLLRSEQGIDPSDEDNAIEQNVVEILGHEMAHHLDMKTPFGTDHGALLSCLEQRYNSVKKDGKPVFEPAHHSETLCDHWGGNALYEYLLAKEAMLGRQLSKREKLEAVRRANGLICNKELGPVNLGFGMSSLDVPDPHPPGRFRIEAILRSNPHLATFMGCSFSPSKATGSKAPVACGMKGEEYTDARQEQAEEADELLR